MRKWQWIRFFIAINWALLLVWAGSAVAAEESPPVYSLKYTVELQPEKDRARVTIDVEPGKYLRYVRFRVLPSYSNIKANGHFDIKAGMGIWQLPEGKGRLRLNVKISREKGKEGRYDARMTKDWAIFRGDSIIPAVYTDELPGATSQAELNFKLPEGWSIETGWPRIRGNRFRIDNPERRFDRPVGWMIAGKLGTRRTYVGDTQIVVSAPQGENFRRMDMLTFLTFVWPQMQKAFETSPDKLLIVGAGDPMWRGGLSGPNSFYLHADRPIVSENGTSPMVHELVHMVTRIRGVKEDAISDDWFAEGMAEFYSFELLYRAGALTKERRAQIISHLGNWGKDITDLRQERSSGPVTARAAVLLDELDKELRSTTSDQRNLDHLVRLLMPKRRVSLADIQAAAKEILGRESRVLQSPLLNRTGE
jgi:hypothetical protein